MAWVYHNRYVVCTLAPSETHCSSLVTVANHMENTTMREAYNVARVDDFGVEIIQMYPPLTKRDAREVRVKMQRTFKSNKYVVVNVNTMTNPEKNHEV